MGRPRNSNGPDKSALYVRLEQWGCQRDGSNTIVIRRLAELLDMTTSTLGAWKTSTSVPERYYIDHLTSVTGIPKRELLSLRDQLEEWIEAEKAARRRGKPGASLNGRRKRPPKTG